MTPTTACIARVRGHVQGVGFRWWIRSELTRLDLQGGATNLADGSVEVTVRGDSAAVHTLLGELRGPRAPGRIDSVEIQRSGP